MDLGRNITPSRDLAECHVRGLANRISTRCQPDININQISTRYQPDINHFVVIIVANSPGMHCRIDAFYAFDLAGILSQATKRNRSLTTANPAPNNGMTLVSTLAGP